MFKKMFAFAALSLLALPAFAEKPFAVAVCSDQSVPLYQNQQDARCASLVQEYYKSELATQARLVLCSSELLQDTLVELKHKNGTAYTENEIKTLTEKAKADFVAFLTVRRQENNAFIQVTLYDKNGKKLDKQLSQPISTIRESDLPAVRLALDTAKALRGDNVADVLAQERERDLREKIEADRAAEQKKAQKRARLTSPR